MKRRYEGTICYEDLTRKEHKKLCSFIKGCSLPKENIKETLENLEICIDYIIFDNEGEIEEFFYV